MKLLECPNCKNTLLRILLINRFKKRHYYLIWCANCDWSQKFNHKLGFCTDKPFSKSLLEGNKPMFNKEQLRERGRLNIEENEPNKKNE